MLDPTAVFLEKARESLEGARRAYEGGRYNNVANRSYYAVFLAAIHALQREGVRPPGGSEWGHAFVDAQFVGLLINRRHRYDSGLRGVIGENRSLREDADYTTIQVSHIRASRSLQRAERFVSAVLQRYQGSS